VCRKNVCVFVCVCVFHDTRIAGVSISGLGEICVTTNVNVNVLEKERGTGERVF